MKKNYIYITTNTEYNEIIGANKTIEGTAKMIKEYIEDGSTRDIEVFADKLVEVMKKHEENEEGYVLGWEDDLIEGKQYVTFIINSIEEHILQSLEVEKVLLEK